MSSPEEGRANTENREDTESPEYVFSSFLPHQPSISIMLQVFLFLRHYLCQIQVLAYGMLKYMYVG